MRRSCNQTCAYKLSMLDCKKFRNYRLYFTHSRREFMFIGIFKAIHLNPEGIICPNGAFLHKIPSGLRKNRCLVYYKHTFPSGIYGRFTLRHKADNSEKFYKRIQINKILRGSFFLSLISSLTHSNV